MSNFSNLLLSSVSAYIDVTVREPFRALNVPQSKTPKLTNGSQRSFSFLETMRKQRRMCSPEVRVYGLSNRRSLRDEYFKSIEKLNAH